MQSPPAAAPAPASLASPSAPPAPVPGGDAPESVAYEPLRSSPSSDASSAPAVPSAAARGAAGGCVFARRVRGLPAVQALLGAYAGAKAYPGVGWGIAVAEQSALLAAVVCRPGAAVCRWPLSCGDWCLCKALDVAESIFPCVSVPPNQVFGLKKDYVVNCICCPPRTAAKLLAKICPACSQEN